MKKLSIVIFLALMIMVFTGCGDKDDHIGEAKTPSDSAGVKKIR